MELQTREVQLLLLLVIRQEAALQVSKETVID